MKSTGKFAVCIFADKEMLITPRKIYQILDDKPGARSNYIRIVDDEGEDYLYPAKYFVVVPVTREIESTLLQVA